MWWKCPNCNSKVNFKEQMEYVFDEDGESDFCPESGLWLHTIICSNKECNAEWYVSISGMKQNSL